jgi:hypothetical protein
MGKSSPFCLCRLNDKLIYFRILTVIRRLGQERQNQAYLRGCRAINRGYGSRVLILPYESL